MKMIYSNENLLFKKVEKLRLKKKMIGLCHGCFDILHWGHLLHFKNAKKPNPLGSFGYYDSSQKIISKLYEN